MGWDLLFMHQKSKKGTKVTWAVVAHGFVSMGAASGKVKYLKPSAFEIPQCCWENKRENTVVPFQHEMFLWCFLRDWSVLPWWGGCARWGAAEQGWQAGTVIPLQTAFPQGSCGLSEAEPVQLREAETQQGFHPHEMPVVLLAEHWEGAGYLDVGTNLFC